MMGGVAGGGHGGGTAGKGRFWVPTLPASRFPGLVPCRSLKDADFHLTPVTVTVTAAAPDVAPSQNKG